MAVVEMESLFSTPMPSILETPPRIQSADQNQLTQIVYKIINIMEHFVTDFQEFNPISTSRVGVPPTTPSTQTFWKILESINWWGLCFCDFQFISISHILQNLQGSAALRSPAVAILLEALENFRKFLILYKFHIFCILATLQYFGEKITFNDKVM